jgi:23S rRNA pseudouridine2605 synthase
VPSEAPEPPQERHAVEAPEPPPRAEGLRLQKVLAAAGIGSRRSSEEMIAEGRVTVNGVPAHLGQRVDQRFDRIEVDGIPLPGREGLVYYLLHKPVGVVSTASDPEGRTTVVQLVPKGERVYPVGRLDAASEGLLLLTNDGDLAYHLMHPAFGVEKEYVVEVQGTLSREVLGRLRRGVHLEDGVTAPARVHQLGPRTARVIIHEGRKRQVRRMFDAVGHPVSRLVRVRVGPVNDDGLGPGQVRELAPNEVMALWEAAIGPGSATGNRRSRM